MDAVDVLPPGRAKTKILAGARKQKQKTFSQVKIPVEILLYPREK